MKKIKMMLLSLALFAVVGGTLAFKAKFDEIFCTTNAIEVAQGVFTCLDPDNGNAPLTCPITGDGMEIDPNPTAPPIYCTITVDIFGQCPGQPCLSIPVSLRTQDHQ